MLRAKLSILANGRDTCSPAVQRRAVVRGVLHAVLLAVLR
jgi:hypothetical protein